MQLNPSEISELIKSRISEMGVDTQSRNEGTVISVTDGICRVHGLSGVMQGEMLEFPNNTIGLALNLERDSVGAVVLVNTPTLKKVTQLNVLAAFWKFRLAQSCSVAL